MFEIKHTRSLPFIYIKKCVRREFIYLDRAGEKQSTWAPDVIIFLVMKIYIPYLYFCKVIGREYNFFITRKIN